ncbi:LamG domain-containing protein [Gaetbulibacter saemankumensis]|uniref:LamG domain-containing protein n=1 Tax=Gaetbulibacter saemankumensis TaxID=311208 RepID=UPI00041BF98F|nr:LamG-like jellyroll fold domain-containing protein [Gaetbulibacter saemankumensis]
MLGQNYLTTIDYVFASEYSIDSINNLQQGTRAFFLEIVKNQSHYTVLNSKEKSSLKSVLDTLQNFLNDNKDEVVAIVLRGDLDKTQLMHDLSFEYSNDVFFVTENKDVNIEKLKEIDKRLIVVFNQDLTESSIGRIQKKRKYLDRFTVNPLDKFVVFKSNATSDSLLFREVFEFWKTTGKSPNFILADHIKTERIKHVADSLNRTRRFRGVMRYGGELLNEIYWNNLPNVITSAKFSFPLTTNQQVLAPYKNGFRITPAEMIHHTGQSDAPRMFLAYNVSIEDELKYDFSFDNDVVNTQEKDWDRVIKKDISFIEDDNRGSVLYLNKEDSFIDYFKANNLNFETPISISVWLKPEKHTSYMGILGFGLAFSVKLKKGNPDFTMATIKDHVVAHPLEVGVWQHLVIVYNPRASIVFYLNGDKIGDVEALDINPSEKSLVVGNNIWGEQFFGAIDDLKVWNRGLAPNEVKLLFTDNSSNRSFNFIGISLGIGGLVVLGMLVLIYRNKSRTNKRIKFLKTKSAAYKLNQEQKQVKQNKLCLFGNFYLELKNTEAPSFSPLHKQIMSFLILSMLEDSTGVTTNKLTETFWPGVSKAKAKENRSGNIRKLRMVLSKVEGIEVVFNENKWSVVYDDSFQIDVFEYLRLRSILEIGLSKDDVSIGDLEIFLELIKKGNVLQSIHNEWIDYFKAKLSNEIESLLTEIYARQANNLPKELCIIIGKTILLFDSLNENALQILVREWISLGKHGLAQDAYLTFSKNYELLYGELYMVEYQDFIKEIALDKKIF